MRCGSREPRERDIGSRRARQPATTGSPDRLPVVAVRVGGSKTGSRDPRERSERGLGRRDLPVGRRTAT